MNIRICQIFTKAEGRIIFDDIKEFKAGDAANRGDIAILIWNALRTGVCDIIGENNKGVLYDNNDKPTINNFTATANPGQKIAIVGPVAVSR